MAERSREKKSRKCFRNVAAGDPKPHKNEPKSPKGAYKEGRLLKNYYEKKRFETFETAQNLVEKRGPEPWDPFSEKSAEKREHAAGMLLKAIVGPGQYPGGVCKRDLIPGSSPRKSDA